MCIPEIVDEDCAPTPADFSVSDFANKSFKMFDGEETDGNIRMSELSDEENNR